MIIFYVHVRIYILLEKHRTVLNFATSHPPECVRLHDSVGNCLSWLIVFPVFLMFVGSSLNISWGREMGPRMSVYYGQVIILSNVYLCPRLGWLGFRLTCVRRFIRFGLWSPVSDICIWISPIWKRRQIEPAHSPTSRTSPEREDWMYVSKNTKRKIYLHQGFSNFVIPKLPKIIHKFPRLRIFAN
jgi:hypothetical protein